MAQTGMVVTGLQDCILLLEEAPRNIVMLGFARALTAAIYVITEAVIQRTPVKTGLTARGLVVDVAIIDKVGKEVGGTAAMGFGREGYVAMFVEYGHRNVGHKPDKKYLGSDTPPHPFMRPGFDASAEDAIDAFAASLADTLRVNYPGK